MVDVALNLPVQLPAPSVSTPAAGSAASTDRAASPEAKPRNPNDKSFSDVLENARDREQGEERPRQSSRKSEDEGVAVQQAPQEYRAPARTNTVEATSVEPGEELLPADAEGLAALILEQFPEGFSDQDAMQEAVDALPADASPRDIFASLVALMEQGAAAMNGKVETPATPQTTPAPQVAVPAATLPQPEAVDVPAADNQNILPFPLPVAETVVKAAAAPERVVQLITDLAENFPLAAKTDAAATSLTTPANDASPLPTSAPAPVTAAQPAPADPLAALPAEQPVPEKTAPLPQLVTQSQPAAPETQPQVPATATGPHAQAAQQHSALPKASGETAAVTKANAADTAAKTDAADVADAAEAVQPVVTTGTDSSAGNSTEGGDTAQQDAGNYASLSPQPGNSSRADNAPSFARVLTEAQTAAPADQLNAHIKTASKNGETRMEVQMSPEELGKVNIRLSVVDGRASMHITAEKPQTLDMLRSDVQKLENMLRDVGLKTDSGSLSFNLRGEGQPGQQQQNQQGNGHAYRGRTVDALEEVMNQQVARVYTLEEADGLDIRI